MAFMKLFKRSKQEENKSPETQGGTSLPAQYDASQYADVVKTYAQSNEPLIKPVAKIGESISNETTTQQKRKPRWFWWVLIFGLFLFFFTPFRINTLILGIDRPPEGTWIGRSDTMILTTLPPVLPQLSMLSIPRDLWVTIPGQYENRINTAHYFAELDKQGSGKKAAAEVIKTNFGVNVNYVVRIKFDGFVKVVDAMGGVTVNLPVDMSGMTAGKHHLDGTQALRFVRDRAGSDDFFRQQRGQLFLSSAVKEMLNPVKWPLIPAVFTATVSSIDSNIPFWVWPRLTYGILFSAVKGFDSHTLDREMVTGWTTNEGAQVLLPNWDKINPLLYKLFKQ
jgi:LCP family protein required for cell wall assembly